MMKRIGFFVLDLLFVAVIALPLCYWLYAPWYASFSIVAVVSLLNSIINDLTKIKKNLEPRIWYDRNK